MRRRFLTRTSIVLHDVYAQGLNLVEKLAMVFCGRISPFASKLSWFFYDELSGVGLKV